ncbi:uncharacterized protein LOC123660589 [Melitaea cinxia]|uniref:uncharacterized protein LOC123660589 n=1 Tax=Melitaea cinxia TaxID=113334 RepID=UPI001E271E0E|nr:uncharacterized protein LOC123660589 [Melitaea cinxia]
MKLLIVVLGLALAVTAEEPIFRDYHLEIGIPERARIDAAEAAADFDGSRIIGGQASALGANPHLAGLQITLTTGQRSVCGSSLISNTRLVTAAHCWRSGGAQARTFIVILGSVNYNSGGVRISTSNVVMHPSYNMNTLRNDVAVIRISRVNFNNNIRAISLATGSNNYVGVTAVAAGFGRTSNTGSVSSVARHVSLQVIDNNTCARVYGTAVVGSSTLCTSNSGGRSTCGGDSGGPLAVGNTLQTQQQNRSYFRKPKMKRMQVKGEEQSIRFVQMDLIEVQTTHIAVVGQKYNTVFKANVRVQNNALSSNMKLLIVVLGLALAVTAEEPIFRDYHLEIGIPERARIDAAEAAADFDGSRIIGGQVSALGANPHLAGLQITLTTGQRSVCGSSLISNTRLVTAAHCWRSGGVQARTFTVILGSVNYNSGGIRISTSNVVMHPSYNMNTLRNDVAVIRISRVNFNNNIRAISLATGSNNYVGVTAVAAGFGRTSNTGSVSSVARHVSLQVIDNNTCARVYGTAVVGSSTLCTSNSGGRSTCGGDSGGPLAVGNTLVSNYFSLFSRLLFCTSNDFTFYFTEIQFPLLIFITFLLFCIVFYFVLVMTSIFTLQTQQQNRSYFRKPKMKRMQVKGEEQSIRFVQMDLIEVQTTHIAVVGQKYNTVFKANVRVQNNALSSNMKLLIVVLGLALAVTAEEPIFRDYHLEIGIPERARIDAAEAAADFDGSRIIGGQVSALGANPHLAGLQITLTTGQRSVCGSSLISNTRLVTAAHCWRSGGVQARTFTVILGSVNYNSGGIRISTSNVVMHPSYNMNTLRNDVAVIRISRVNFNNNIRAISLATGSNNYVGVTAVAAGFGRTSNTGSVSSVARHVSLQVIDNNTCARVYGTAVVGSSTLCTSNSGGRSTCGGDSGGPLAVGNTLVSNYFSLFSRLLFCTSNDFTFYFTEIQFPLLIFITFLLFCIVFYFVLVMTSIFTLLIGITSFGSAAGCTLAPAGFARVTSFASWLRSQ